MILERVFKKTRNEYGVLLLCNTNHWIIYQNKFNYGWRHFGVKIFKDLTFYTLTLAIYYGVGELVFDYTWKRGRENDRQ
jgi:hypothetical protein